MTYAVLSVHMQIPNSFSLKDKRRIIKSLIDKIKNKFNVSISEIDKNDVWNEAVLNCAHISNSNKFSNQYLNEVLHFFDQSAFEYVILDYSINIL